LEDEGLLLMEGGVGKELIGVIFLDGAQKEAVQRREGGGW
jgi:hypothetical protein